MTDITNDVTAPGTDIKTAIDNALAYVRRYNAPTYFTFNGARVDVDATTDRLDALNAWRAQMEANAQAYRESPAGKKAQDEANAVLRATQAKADNLNSTMGCLLSGDKVKILSWLRDAAHCDHSGIHFPSAATLLTLKGAGYVTNANTDNNYMADDADNCFRCIVGQCMSFFEEGMVPHPSTIGFIDDWMLKFNPK